MKKPYITKLHVILEIVGLILIVIAFIYAFIKIATIDGQIPTHFNMQGEVDGYGSPLTMLLLPAIMLGTNLLIAGCAHFLPVQMFNLPFKPKQGRELTIYKDCILMVALLELEDGIFTLGITLSFLNGKAGFVMTMVYLALIFATIFLVIIKMYKDNK